VLVMISQTHVSEPAAALTPAAWSGNEPVYLQTSAALLTSLRTRRHIYCTVAPMELDVPTSLLNVALTEAMLFTRLCPVGTEP
jgi:hypothetical protein